MPFNREQIVVVTRRGNERYLIKELEESISTSVMIFSKAFRYFCCSIWRHSEEDGIDLDRDAFDGTFVGASSNTEVASLAPTRSPRVLHDPVRNAGFFFSAIPETAE